MATLIAKRVTSETTKLEKWQEEQGKFRDVPKFGLSSIKDYTSKAGNKFYQCESLAFVAPGQFVRHLEENPNLKFGKLSPVNDENGNQIKDEHGKLIWDLELFEDEQRETIWSLDADGKLLLLE